MEPRVRLTELSLANFRNLAAAVLEVPADGAVLVGANGQGKTSVLEAIHYLALFRSFRGVRHSEAIRFAEDHFRVAGGVAYGDGRTRTVAVAADRTTRRISLDGQTTRRPGDAVGTVLTVLMTPEDLALIGGGPGGRRRYLDTLLALTSRACWRALLEYDRVLRQRNELLRARVPSPAAVRESWDAALVAAGTGLIVARGKLTARLDARFADVGALIAGDEDGSALTLAYRSSISGAPAALDDPAAIADAWLAALSATEREDRARGWTTVGPHRDDLEVRLGGRSLARFGSQGERRTAAISLRLLEAEILEADTGHPPILLLDDVFSELDPGRAERLVARLGPARQRFITTPRPLPWLEPTLARWDVAAGCITPRAAA